MRIIEFVSYDGAYPNLCSGELIVKIDGKETSLGKCLCSGGSVWFNEDYSNFTVEEGPWHIDTDWFPKDLHLTAEEVCAIEHLVNENVEWGCCGGCS